MVKKQKGTTLIEVLVSIAVFSIISVAMFSSFLGMRKLVSRQEEYLQFEIVCQDIGFYGDVYGKNWYEKYFDEETVTGTREQGVVYFDNGFTPSATERVYRLEYFYNAYNELIVSIFHEETGRAIVESLNYGGGRYGEA